MRPHCAITVVARLTRADVDPAKFIPMHRKPGKLLVVEDEADRHAVKRPVRLYRAPYLVDVLSRDETDLDQSTQGDVDVWRLLRNQLELVAWLIIDQNGAVPIEDETAVRRLRFEPNSVALRRLNVVIVPNDLQVEQPRYDDCQGHDDKETSEDRTTNKEPLLLPQILNVCATGHRIPKYSDRSAKGV